MKIDMYVETASINKFAFNGCIHCLNATEIGGWYSVRSLHLSQHSALPSVNCATLTKSDRLEHLRNYRVHSLLQQFTGLTCKNSGRIQICQEGAAQNTQKRLRIVEGNWCSKVGGPAARWVYLRPNQVSCLLCSAPAYSTNRTISHETPRKSTVPVQNYAKTNKADSPQFSPNMEAQQVSEIRFEVKEATNLPEKQTCSCGSPSDTNHTQSYLQRFD